MEILDIFFSLPPPPFSPPLPPPPLPPHPPPPPAPPVPSPRARVRIRRQNAARVSPAPHNYGRVYNICHLIHRQPRVVPPASFSRPRPVPPLVKPRRPPLHFPGPLGPSRPIRRCIPKPRRGVSQTRITFHVPTPSTGIPGVYHFSPPRQPTYARA